MAKASRCLRQTLVAPACPSFRLPGNAYQSACTTSSELINYGYPAGFPNTRDTALVILDEPIVLSEYGVLATVPEGEIITIVGL